MGEKEIANPAILLDGPTKGICAAFIEERLNLGGQKVSGTNGLEGLFLS
jgi:hypothetical protein